MKTLHENLLEQTPRYLDELFELLRIPSVSAVPDHKPDMLHCAERYAALLLKSGADTADVYPTKGHPVVFAEKKVDPALPTALIYGHYDVQPADPLDLWKTPPFEPEIREGAIYARGANDDKGQSFLHVKAMEYLLSKGKLTCNLKFLIEGEEEIGSPSLASWAADHKELLACDFILVSDTTMIDEDVPSINCGMRGLAYVQVKVTGPNKDVHSGHYGGAIANPINTLCGMIAKLVDEQGRITVPGIYDPVVELNTEERAMLARAPFDETAYKTSLGIKAVQGEAGYSTLERTGIRPCLDVCGIWGGYTGEGAKTVLPSFAQAKVSMRLVPNQDYKIVTEQLMAHLKTLAPEGVTVETWAEHGGQGFLTPISSPVYKAASQAMSEVYGIEPVPSRGGGSIPILADLQQLLNANPLLLGFGLERDTIHSPNESFLLSQFQRGLATIIRFYELLPESGLIKR
jgi:acetylornithine deacetylase/succinyl-diaminopimelate desuccinylase-like protein